MNINKLFAIIKQRQKDMPEKSYVTSLFKEGKERIIQKVGEEAIEVVIAAKNDSKEKLIAEMADLWFHSLVLLAASELNVDDVMEELKKRNKK